MTKYLDVDRFPYVRKSAQEAHETMMDALNSEILGKKAEVRRSGKLKATHAYEAFRGFASPRKVLEIIDAYREACEDANKWRHAMEDEPDFIVKVAKFVGKMFVALLILGLGAYLHSKYGWPLHD